MRSGSQNPNTVSVWDPLDLDEMQPPLPRIDTENLVPTYHVDPAWLKVEPLVYQYNASTNGTGFDITVESDFTQASGSQIIDREKNQLWHTIFFMYIGGSVSPQRWRMRLDNKTGTTYQIFEDRNFTNPGTITFGNLLISSGFDLGFYGLTAGGAADSITIVVQGVQARPGLPLPVIPWSGVYGS